MIERKRKTIEPIRTQSLTPEQAFINGENFTSWEYFAHHKEEQDGKVGWRFRVWAPNALNVYLVGDFTEWWEDQIQMQKDEETGVWSVWTDRPEVGELYKFKVKQANGSESMKIDPFARSFEKRPGMACVVGELTPKVWADDTWYERRKEEDTKVEARNIYYMHAGSWKFKEDGTTYTFEELKNELIPYLLELNYTHVQFMSLVEHPKTASYGIWGIGFYAPCSTYGTPEQLQDFVEACHLAGLAVLMDFTIGQFNAIEDALSYYDGTPQFEYVDRNRARNFKHGTKNFDLGKGQVVSFLLSSVFYWLKVFHFDGVSIPFVTNIIARDQDGGPWSPNIDGGHSNLEGLAFIQKMSRIIRKEAPYVKIIAEEHTNRMKVTTLFEYGGLGFDWKLNTDWEKRTLEFYKMDPIYRQYHYDDLLLTTMDRMFDEAHFLPIIDPIANQDKMTVYDTMFGKDEWRKFAQMRNLMVYQKTFPGKKVTSMGLEFGNCHPIEFDSPLHWELLEEKHHKEFWHFNKKLNEFYRNTAPLYQMDYSFDGFALLDGRSKERTIFAYMRRTDDEKNFVIVVLNMTPVEYSNHFINVPIKTAYEEVFNSELNEFGGVWKEGNDILLATDWNEGENFSYKIEVSLPAFGALVFQPVSKST